MTPILPVVRIIVQHPTNYDYVVLDGTAGIVVLPGDGGGVLAHGGKVYPFVAADPTARTKPGDFDPTHLLGLLALVEAKPGDDLAALLATGGAVEVPPGASFPSFSVPK